jgi:hypothetical protein
VARPSKQAKPPGSVWAWAGRLCLSFDAHLYIPRKPIIPGGWMLS